MSGSSLSSTAQAYSDQNGAYFYTNETEQAGAASQAMIRTANLSNASKAGVASSQENIYVSTYSGPPEDPNNGNTDVHKFKFDPNAQGDNDKIYTSMSDVPPGLRAKRFGSSMGRPTSTKFHTAQMSAAVASSTVTDALNATVQSHPVSAVSGSASGPAASGSQGASVSVPGANGAYTYGLSL